MGRVYNQYGELVGYYHGGHVYKGRGHEYHDDAIVARIQGNEIYSGGKCCFTGYDNMLGSVWKGEIRDRSGCLIGKYKDGIVYGNWNLFMMDTVEHAFSKEIGHYEDGDEVGGALAALVLLIGKNNTITSTQTHNHNRNQSMSDIPDSLRYTGPSFEDLTGILDVFCVLNIDRKMEKNKINFILFMIMFALVYSVSLYLVKIDWVGYHLSSPWGGNVMTMVRHIVRVFICVIAAYSVVRSIDNAESQLTKVTRSLFGMIWLFVRHAELKLMLWIATVLVLSMVELIVLIFSGTGFSNSPFSMADLFMWDLFY